jgi:hypothetical protein
MTELIKPDRIEWRPVGEFRIDGSRVYIGDSWMISCAQVDAPVTPGVYDIDIKLHYYGSDDRVALLRGRLQGSAPDGERAAGEFGVDVASAGVIDADAVDRWAAADEKALEAWQETFCEDGHVNDYAAFFPCAAIGSSMLHTSTGFGDGGYNAVTLLEREKPVGFELRFLDDEGYSNEPPRPMTWKERAHLVLVSPILLIVGIPIAILVSIAHWSTKLAKLFGRKR